MKKISAAAVVGLALCMAGCTTETDTDGLVDAVNRYLDGEFGLCQTNSLSELPDSDTMRAFLDSCYVKSVKDGTVVLAVPDYTNVVEVLQGDSYFAEIRDDQELAQEYYCSVLKNEDVKKDISWSVSWDGTGLSDGRVLLEAASAIVNGNIVLDIAENSTADSKNAFTFTIGSNKVLVSGIEVVTGQEAIDRLYQAGNANKNYEAPASGEVFFVHYRVTNLSDGKLHIPPLFTVVSDGRIVKNVSDYVGLSQEADLLYAESAEFEAFMAGPEGSSVYFVYDGCGMPV